MSRAAVNKTVKGHLSRNREGEHQPPKTTETIRGLLCAISIFIIARAAAADGEQSGDRTGARPGPAATGRGGPRK